MTTRRLLLCGVIAGPLFTAVLIGQDLTRAHFDPMRHPGSSLAIGDWGWIQILNFLVCGALTVAYAVGVRGSLRERGRTSFWGPLLIGVWGVGLIGAGVFVADPIGGYPPGTPPSGVHTWHGQLHDVPFSVVAFLAMPVLFFVFARRFFGWREPVWGFVSLVTGLLVLAGFLLFGTGFDQQASALSEIAGLLQRITIVVAWTWLTALAIHLRRAAEGEKVSAVRR
ncbi:MAG: DUF998 domain-containing protein [Hamadaea sp.]|nr:DUF998 domain-containing protein [Hamadaea sp.]